MLLPLLTFLSLALVAGAKPNSQIPILSSSIGNERDCVTSCGVDCPCPSGSQCLIDLDCLTNRCEDYICTARDAGKGGNDANKGSSGAKLVGEGCDANNLCQSGLVCSWGRCQSVYWQNLDFSDGITVPGKFSSKWQIQKDMYGSHNRVTVYDPAGSGSVSLRVVYPAGSVNPRQGKRVGNVGGTGIICDPVQISSYNTITLEYQVMFPAGFNFVLGGKLPGLYGGRSSCSGGDSAQDCFSTRLMWRKNGQGEVYIYIDKSAQLPQFCTKMTACKPHTTYGYSLGRGNFIFPTGRWTTVKQIMRMNTFEPNGKYNNDGVIALFIDGKLVIQSNIVAFTTLSHVRPKGVDFETFFGGHKPEWATPRTQYTYFQRFRLGGY